MRWGNVLIIGGLVFVVLGLIVRFVPGLVSWFGRLPGDIRIEGESSRVYIPITSMLLVSLALSALVAIFGRGRG